MTAKPGPGGHGDQNGVERGGLAEAAAGLIFRIPFWCLICLLAAGIHSWSHAHAMNPDGLVYLDMATEALRDGPSNLINGLWSPAFPALMALVLSVISPGPAMEFPVAHGVNFLAYCLALFCFVYLIKPWRLADGGGKAASGPSYETPFGFGVFLWFTIQFIGLKYVTPDLLMAGAVFLAAGICCRIHEGETGVSRFVQLGVVLGVGYYIKAPMLPMGALLLASLLAWPPNPGFRRRRLLLAVGVFLAVSMPLIVLMSVHLGRPSLGESGRLNYAWHVNGLKQMAWTGGGDGSLGSPNHPPRTILEKPLVLEFATPVKGTYPLWYDPSYWYAGAKIRFSPAEQVRALVRSASEFWWASQLQAPLIAGILVILLMSRRRAAAGPARLGLVLTGWAFTACLIFAMVHVEFRYIAAFFVPAWLAVYRWGGKGLEDNARAAVMLSVALVMTIQVAADLPGLASQALSRSRNAIVPSYISVAEGLRSAGVKQGDRLATVDLALDAFYARYNGSRIVAHVFPPNDGEGMTPEDWARVRKSLHDIGVTALVAKKRPTGAMSGEWSDLPAAGFDHYSVMLIEPAGSVTP